MREMKAELQKEIEELLQRPASDALNTKISSLEQEVKQLKSSSASTAEADVVSLKKMIKLISSEQSDLKDEQMEIVNANETFKDELQMLTNRVASVESSWHDLVCSVFASDTSC